ncbi:hypothetical protein Btru_043771, partial [Bulinus truncatus]
MSSVLKPSRSRKQQPVTRQRMEIATISGNDIFDEALDQGPLDLDPLETPGPLELLDNAPQAENKYPRDKQKRSHDAMTGDPVLRETPAIREKKKKRKRSERRYQMCCCCCAEDEQEPLFELAENAEGAVGVSPSIREPSTATGMPVAQVDDRTTEGTFESLTLPPTSVRLYQVQDTAVNRPWGNSSAVSDNGLGRATDTASASGGGGGLSVLRVSVPRIVVSVDVEVGRIEDNYQGLYTQTEPPGACCSAMMEHYMSADEISQAGSVGSGNSLQVPTLGRRSSSRRQSLSSGFEFSQL